MKNDMIRLPVGIAPPFANCFLAVLLNDPIPRKDMAALCKYVSLNCKICWKSVYETVIHNLGRPKTQLNFSAKLMNMENYTV